MYRQNASVIIDRVACDRRPVAQLIMFRRRSFFVVGQRIGPECPVRENNTVHFGSMPPAAITAPSVVLLATSLDANST